MKPRVRKGRERIQPYVAGPLRQRLSKYCAAEGITESACVEAALKQYLEQGGDWTLVLRRLDRLGRGNARHQRDLELTLETLSTWIHIWFAHTPSIADDAKQFATTQAEARYRRFIDHVARRFSGGERFTRDLPQEALAAREALSSAHPQDASTEES